MLCGSFGTDPSFAFSSSLRLAGNSPFLELNVCTCCEMVLMSVILWTFLLYAFMRIKMGIIAAKRIQRTTTKTAYSAIEYHLLFQCEREVCHGIVYNDI